MPATITSSSPSSGVPLAIPLICRQYNPSENNIFGLYPISNPKSDTPKSLSSSAQLTVLSFQLLYPTSNMMLSQELLGKKEKTTIAIVGGVGFEGLENNTQPQTTNSLSSSSLSTSSTESTQGDMPSNMEVQPLGASQIKMMYPTVIASSSSTSQVVLPRSWFFVVTLTSGRELEAYCYNWHPAIVEQCNKLFRNMCNLLYLKQQLLANISLQKVA